MAELYLMSKSDVEIKTHVIFIHGLSGHYENTWLSTDSDKTFWPKWLNEEMEGLGIWSVGYMNPKTRWRIPSTMHFTDRAKDILHRLRQEPLLGEGEIILVGHSMGGLLIKQMFHYSERNSLLQDVTKRVSKVCFLATPHRGSSGANFLDRLRVIAHPSVSTLSLLKNDPNLRELNEWYRAWISDRDIEHLVLMESQPFKRLITVVTPDSADPGLKNTEALLVDADHLSITKPDSKQAQIYKHIKHFLAKQTKPPQLRWLNSRFLEENLGWQVYDNWSNSPKGVMENFILDSKVRLFEVSSGDLKGRTALETIEVLRTKLHTNRSPIRFVGLSGVGKTRFVQALFDDRLGENALSKEEVFYTDMGHTPNPSPRAVVEKLVIEGKKAIVIIDNCPSELHRDLAPLCTDTVSLLTIEYDIREDQLEGTDVLSLEPASDDLIIELLKARITHLSDQDARKVAEFSGGNSRIAIALASTVEQSESISHLKDEQLFRRLFHQRHQEKNALLQAAQALSIIYSFQYKGDKEPYSGDMKLLSELSNIPKNILYESAQELKRRGLVQQRGVWMAVLPLPIANRLAKISLQDIPTNQITKFINENTNRRFLQSFSRRLSYLDNCTEAMDVVDHWLENDGTICKLLDNYENELAFKLLTNSAPLKPNESLIFIDKLSKRDTKILTRENPELSKLAELLRSLAYDPKLFPKSSRILAKIAVSEKKSGNYNLITDVLKSLFFLYLSGTHAHKEQRLDVVKELIESGSENQIAIGFELLHAALESSNFSSHLSFDFGASSRNYGYMPSTDKEYVEWYKFFVEYTTSLISTNGNYSKKAKSTLGSHLSQLFRQRILWDIMEDAVNVILSNDEWSEGWLQLGAFLAFNESKLSEKDASRVQALLEKLRPSSLDEKIHMYLLSDDSDFFFLDKENSNNLGGYEIALQDSQNLGEMLVSENPGYLSSKLPEILSSNEKLGCLYSFGVGCAKGALEHETFWRALLDNLSQIPREKQNANVLRGFISHLGDAAPELKDALLETLLRDERVSYWFPWVQFSTTLDAKATKRLLQSLDKQLSPIYLYESLGHGRIHEALPDLELCKILRKINEQPNGLPIVIGILSMRFHGLNIKSSYSPSDEIKVFSQEILCLTDFSKADVRGVSDHNLHNIAKVALSTSNNTLATQAILERMFETRHIMNFEYQFPMTLKVLLDANLEAVLDSLIDEKANIREHAVRFFRNNRLPLLPLDLINDWCKEKTEVSCLALAEVITPFKKDEDIYQLSDEARMVLERSVNPLKVLEKLEKAFYPKLRSGSLVSELKSRLSVYSELEQYENSQIRKWATSEKSLLLRKIEAQQEYEDNLDRETDERFE